MRAFFLILLFIGIGMVMYAYVDAVKTCPPSKTEYRYVPRSFYEEQLQPTPATEIFGKMFAFPSAWVTYPLAGGPETTMDIYREANIQE